MTIGPNTVSDLRVLRFASKSFAAYRPREMNASDSRFFLAIKHNRASNDPVWYKKSPLGKNQIGKFLSVAAHPSRHRG